MNLYQCQKEAEDIGFNSAVFKGKFPSGDFNCKWVDAYFGFFKVDAPGMSGMVSVSQINEMFPDLICEDLRVQTTA